MAHFYGEVKGRRKPVHRLGTKTSGLRVTAASWQQGAVQVFLSENNGTDFATISLIPWNGQGNFRLIYYGPISGESKTPKTPLEKAEAVFEKYVEHLPDLPDSDYADRDPKETARELQALIREALR